MPKQKITGSFVALITPFNKDGSVDFGAFRTLLKFQEDRGTSAVLFMGSTGETSMLAPEEKKQIIVETAKMKTPRMPIFFGCTGNNTEATIANVRFAAANGADGASGCALSCAASSSLIRASHSSSSAGGRAFSAGNDPTIPALHCAITRSGTEMMNSGAPITGIDRRPLNNAGMDIRNNPFRYSSGNARRRGIKMPDLIPMMQPRQGWRRYWHSARVT